jgi:Concanavalin A-like lectin/glucanases superfamily
MTPYTDQVLADSPSLFWKLDETVTSGSAVDSSGNGRDGTYQSSPPSVASILPSGEATAIQFDGVFDFVTSTFSPFVAAAGQTFDGYAKRSARSAIDMILAGVGADPPTFQINSSAEDIVWRPNGTDSCQWNFNPVNVGVAFHWALTWDDVTRIAELFIGGSSQGQRKTSTISTGKYTTPGNLRVAARAAGADPFHGTMQMFAAYASVLSAARIAAHAQAAYGHATAQSTLTDGATPRVAIDDPIFVTG